MAKGRKKTKDKKRAKAKRVDALSLTERLIALLYVKGLQPTEAVLRLTALGLKPIQIAPLIGKTSNAVSLLILRGRRARQR